MKFEKTQSFTSEIGTNRDFYKVLPRKLTLNLNDQLIPSLVETDETMFKEVSRVHYQEQPWVTMFQKKLNEISKRRGPWEQDLFNTFVSIIERTWNKEKYHVIGTSGGWDSRMMIMAVSELRKKHGKQWLGDTLFVEGWGEGQLFKRIMNHFGWEEKYYHVYNEDKSPGWMHESSLEFKNYWSRYNGLVTFPINQWWDIYDDLIERKDIQFFTGYGSNETDQMMLKEHHSFQWYTCWHYQLQLENIKFMEETIQPFWDLNWIRKIWEYPAIRENKKRIPQCIVEKLVPPFSDIPILTYEMLSHYRHIDNELLKKCVDNYNNSRFGKRIPCTPTNYVGEYQKWWGYYCMASICEHLLEEGYEIKI